MTRNQRNQIAQKFINECLKVLNKKGKDYSLNEDVFSNFKRNAKRLGLSKYQIWATYWGKHVDSIFNAILHSPKNPQIESEPLENHLMDIINYALILSAMLKEDKKRSPIKNGKFRKIK